MTDHREPGKIILLNGASSAGKSTLARSLQQRLPDPFMHWSFDHLRESNALPMARIRAGELDWTRMRPAVFDGFHRSSVSLCEGRQQPDRGSHHRARAMDGRPGRAAGAIRRVLRRGALSVARAGAPGTAKGGPPPRRGPPGLSERAS